MAWHEELWKTGGVLVTALGLVGAAITGYSGYLANGPVLENKRYEIQQTTHLEKMKLEYHLREVSCNNVYAYLEDEKPNTSLTAEQKATASQMLQKNIEACNIPLLPPPDTSTAASQSSIQVKPADTEEVKK